MKRIVATVTAFVLLSAAAVKSQNLPLQLNKVAEALECQRQKTMRGWTRESVEPLLGSKNVLVEMWVTGGRRVKVSFVWHPSEKEAIQSMKDFYSKEKVKKLTDLGDEAYSWGFSDSISMRKDNLMIWISSVSNVSASLTSHNQTEALELRREDEIKLNRNIARMVSHVLSRMHEACPPDRVR